MWPPDPNPEPDPDPGPASRSPPRTAVSGLCALLPAPAFLCSLKGRLLLAESVSAAPLAPPGGAEPPAAAPVRSRRREAPGGSRRLHPPVPEPRLAGSPRSPPKLG